MNDIQTKYFNFMVNELKFSKNIAIGALSQIDSESSFKPWASNTDESERQGSFGLFQWNDSVEDGDRGQMMKDWVDGKGTSNYQEGRWMHDWKRQLEYFKIEPKLLKINGNIVPSQRTYYDDLVASNPASAREASNHITNNNIRPGRSKKNKEGKYIDPHRITQLENRGDYASKLAGDEKDITMYQANKNFLASGGEVGDAFSYKGKSYRSWSDRGSLSKQDDPLRNYK